MPVETSCNFVYDVDEDEDAGGDSPDVSALRSRDCHTSDSSPSTALPDCARSAILVKYSDSDSSAVPLPLHVGGTGLSS